MILMIDNYDSFTWNLVQYLFELGAEVEVVRNDQLSLAKYNSLGRRVPLRTAEIVASSPVRNRAWISWAARSR